MTIIYLITSYELNLEQNNPPQMYFNHSIIVQSNLFQCCLHSRSDLIMTYNRASFIWAQWDQYFFVPFFFLLSGRDDMPTKRKVGM